MNARELKEKELSRHLKTLLCQEGLELLGQEVQIGKFKLDAIAVDREGRIVVIELKVVCTKDALGQLLLYPRAVRQKLPSKEVRSLLITTHLDQGVVEIVDELPWRYGITLMVCVGSVQSGLRLVAPCHPDVKDNQVWDQSKSERSPSNSWNRFVDKLANSDRGAAS